MGAEEGSMVVLRCVLSTSAETYHYIPVYHETLRSLDSCLKGYMKCMLLTYVYKRVDTSFSRLSWKRGARDGKGPLQTCGFKPEKVSKSEY